MSKLIDLTGQRFGRLIVLERAGSLNGQATWKCQCDCGAFVIVRGSQLRAGRSKSCGCLIKDKASETHFQNLQGKRFGKLTALSSMIKNKITYWKCKCDCGNIVFVRQGNLKNGHTTSCGCIKSRAEEKIANILKKNNVEFKREYTFSDLLSKNGNKLRFDFAIFKERELYLLLEYQGEQHYSEISYFSHDLLENRKERDIAKQEYCNKNNIKLVKIPFGDFDKISWDYLKTII